MNRPATQLEVEAAPAAALRTARLYFCGCGALIGFALGYALPIYARLPNLFYHPLGRYWLVAVSAGALPMGYFGQLLWGVAAALISMGLVAVGVVRLRREPEPKTYLLWAAWTLTALLLVVGYFTWNNWP